MKPLSTRKIIAAAVSLPVSVVAKEWLSRQCKWRALLHNRSEFMPVIFYNCASVVKPQGAFVKIKADVPVLRFIKRLQNRVSVHCGAVCGIQSCAIARAGDCLSRQ